VVHRLEVVRDHRALSVHEEELCKLLKLKSLGLASLQRTIARQESRLPWLKEGDANTQFFHFHVNVRYRQKFIHSLEHDGRTLTTEASKEEVLFSFFDDILGMSP
jgi:hypothetical protein